MPAKIKALFAKMEKPIAIVAHDSGAANLLAAWLTHADRSDIAACLAGPATDIFARICPGLPEMPLQNLLATSHTLISGTGWSSNLEHDARKLAGHRHSIAVIDHWTNYSVRFSRENLEILPDALWVADAEAATLARSTFPSLPVQKLPNIYLKNLVSTVRRSEMSAKIRADKLLYVLEPIRDNWGQLPQPGEFLALDFFASHLGYHGLPANPHIRLRPHPSDLPGKYDAWIAAHPQMQLELDDSPTLETALSWAGTVIGCQTYAMVVALAAGRRVVCSIPPGMAACALPQSGILHLAELVD